MNGTDLYGLRTLTVYIHTYFPSGAISKNVKDEFQRVFDECFSHCKKSCHTVVFEWVEEKGKHEDYDDIGKEGHFFGGWPSEWHLMAHDAPGIAMGGLGISSGNTAAIDYSKTKSFSPDGDKGVGIALAHELGYHAIGGDSDWRWRLGNPTDWAGKSSDPETEFVDSNTPSLTSGQNFSKQACEEICDEMGID